MKRCVRFLIFATISFKFSITGSLATDTKSARFVVHLLDYLAKDYPGAILDGKVISESEYQEQIEFSKSTIEINSEILETKPYPEIQKELEELQQLILKKAPAEEISQLARKIQSQLIQFTHLEIAPSSWPNLEQGRQLFTQNCIACHGATGVGDGLAGKNLNPKPTNFLDQEHMKELSPFNALNTIRLGVPGTGMIAFSQLSDQEAWALSFYISSLRYSSNSNPHPSFFIPDQENLKKAATLSDQELSNILSGSRQEIEDTIIAIRTFTGNENEIDYLAIAKSKILEAGAEYKNGNIEQARMTALQAYLENIEPIEARIRANDPDAVALLEERMAGIRAAIEAHKSVEEINQAIQFAIEQIEISAKYLETAEISPWIAFMAAFAILLREGFEAVLIILALLGVIRATGSREATLWVHGGWISALTCGLIAWFFSGWLMQLSGAGRELLEGITSLFAVFVLLYVGFWLHRQTEIGRWKNFLEVKVKGFLHGKNLLGLAIISFIAVFREAIETVLFLRAIWLDAGSNAKTSLVLGVFSSLALVIVLSWIALNYSKKLPIKKLFTISSVMMLILATILTGKGLHSLQEAGLSGVTSFPIHVRWELVGLYPTLETISGQVISFTLVLILWTLGARPTSVAVKVNER